MSPNVINPPKINYRVTNSSNSLCSEPRVFTPYMETLFLYDLFSNEYFHLCLHLASCLSLSASFTKTFYAFQQMSLLSPTTVYFSKNVI